MKPEPSLYDDPDQAAEDAADAEGIAQADTGRLIPHEEVAVWLDTWGTPEFKPARAAWLK
jgi:predicted transcriptional regulator